MPLLAIPIGLLVGLLLGALGGGGSILTVPALVYLLGQDARTATTSSLVIVGITSLIALVPHARAGRVRAVQRLVFGALGTAGSYAGAALSARLSEPALLCAFAALMLVVAVVMYRRSRTAAARDTGEEGGGEAMLSLRPLRCACPRVAKVVVTASVVGLVTGLFGVGGGFVLVPALVLALDFAMPIAVGTSLLVIAVNCVTALTARVGGAVHLDWGVIGVFAGAAVAASLVGGVVTSRIAPERLTRAFAGLLVLVAAYTAVRSIPSLV